MMNTSPTVLRSIPNTAYPSTWLLTSHKIGDNNQVLALAETLGWPYQTKTIVRRENLLTSKLVYKQLLGITLAGIHRSHSSQLTPPWPELVISASRANEMVARWIRKMSGGHTRIVHIGRPKGPLTAFDLIITTPQYFLPERKNILNNKLPLHRITPERLRKAAAKWQPRLSYLKRPYTAVLVGGSTGKCILTREIGCQLGQQVNDLLLTCGGSVLITNSARTPPAAFKELLGQLTMPAHTYQWENGTDDNPFYGYLALADQLVVTAESASMLAEASATGKPLFMFDFSDNKCNSDSVGNASEIWTAKRFKAPRFKRNIGNIQQQLITSGRASWLGELPLTNKHAETTRSLSCDLQRAAARVRLLFHE